VTAETAKRPPALAWSCAAGALLAGLAGMATIAACSSSPAGSADGATPGSDQLPPMGKAALEPWLAAGRYRTAAWTCEAMISAPRIDPDTSIAGEHGRQRVCSNDILLGSDSGPYPVGAASVKEQFDGTDAPYGFAVGVKVAPGRGVDTWYWYERTGRLASLTPLADGIGARACGSDCHALATRDNVFVRAR
jgi:hypothetical protein